MVLTKQEYAKNFGRWVEPNEVVIEDLSEQEIFDIAEKMASVGYKLEYWKSSGQVSGHLHIKDIQFPPDVELTNIQLRRYKLNIMKKYIPKQLWRKVDWNFIKTKRHRIATENEPHYKGYGVKELVKGWNKEKINWSEKDLFEKSIKVRHGSREINVPVDVEELEVLTYKDLLKLKKDKNQIVEGFLSPGTITMIYSPPTNFKSLLAESLGLSIATGREWLKLKVKKSPVLYLDAENSNQLLKERLAGFYNALNLKRHTFPLYFIKNGFIMDNKKKANIGYLAALEREIEDKGIKVIIFDTLHRFAFYDENRSDDINILYTKIFKPLIEDYNVAIVFLHHSTKKGEYRGSGDFLGMVDVSYSIVRQGRTDKFRIINEKCRSGEIEDIRGEIDFGENYIKIIRLDERVEVEKKINKLKEVTEAIKGLFKPGQELRRKDVLDNFEVNEFDFGSTKTLDRSLKFLVDNQFLDKEKGVYTLILR